MPHFIINVNLPNDIPPFNNESCTYVAKMDARLPDSEVWNFAKERDLTIITKDSDFSNRIMLSDPPPKVIHIRFGNLKLKDFIALMTSLWPNILEMHKECKLVNVYKGYIEGIN